MTMPTSTPESTSTASSVALIAGREITTRAREKSFVISTALLMAIIVVGAVVWAALAGRENAERVGLVGGSPSLSAAVEAAGSAAGTTVTVVEVPTADQAERQVSAGDVAAAVLVTGDGGYTLLSDKALGATLSGVLHSAIAQDQLNTELAERGVAATDLPAPAITERPLTATSADVGQRISIALFGSMLLMLAVLTGGVMVSVGVVEEKTSRIVELLLSTVRPAQLLWGKILGIGVIALAQVVLLGATALIAGTATGLLTIAGTATAMFAAVIAWFLLGFLFFAALYAAVGAMVSRQEELNGASTPLTMLAMAVLYAGIFGIQASDATWFQVLSWIPPFSAVLMPIRMAIGDADAAAVAGTFVVMIAGCAAVVWASSRIYHRSVLRTGSRIGWSEVGRMLVGR